MAFLAKKFLKYIDSSLLVFIRLEIKFIKNYFCPLGSVYNKALSALVRNDGHERIASV